MSQSQPPITGTDHELPFKKLSSRDFERLCLWLVEREGWEQAKHLGAGGSDQGRDIVAWLEDEQWAFQCKRVQNFYPKDASAEVEKVLSLPKEQRPARLVFIVACDVSAKTRQQARQRCDGQMECYFWAITELDERVKRHPDIVEEFFQIGDQKENENSTGFLVGERLQDLREEISLTHSEMVEYLSFASEIEYRDIEANDAECPLYLLEEVHQLTGTSLEWLKHGKGPKHKVEPLYWPRPSEAMKQLTSLSPQAICITYDRRQLLVGVCVYIGDFRYRVFDMNLHLRFWDWVDDFRYIPRFYVFLYHLFRVFGYQAQGRKIRWRDHRQLYKGKVHPHSVVPYEEMLFSPPRSWVEDFLNLWGLYSDAEHFEWMYDKRFGRMQKIVRQYEPEIAKMLDIDQEDLPNSVKHLGLKAIDKFNS